MAKSQQCRSVRNPTEGMDVIGSSRTRLTRTALKVIADRTSLLVYHEACEEANLRMRLDENVKPKSLMYVVQTVSEGVLLCNQSFLFLPTWTNFCTLVTQVLCKFS